MRPRRESWPESLAGVFLVTPRGDSVGKISDIYNIELHVTQPINEPEDGTQRPVQVITWIDASGYLSTYKIWER